jgi:hypothetical protein
MEYFYLYIFILLCFIVAVSYYTTYMSSKHTWSEPFKSDKQTFGMEPSEIDSRKLVEINLSAY